jgi:hypothetical protein
MQASKPAPVSQQADTAVVSDYLIDSSAILGACHIHSVILSLFDINVHQVA